MNRRNPIDQVEWRAAAELDANSYNPNRVHKAEARLLELSLVTTGWIQPILANPDGLIIDGFHRWRLAQDSAAVGALSEPWHPHAYVPVVTLELDRGEAMLMTIRINRAKGTHVAVEMSKIVHELLEVHGYAKDEVARQIGATKAEVELLAQDGVFQAANIKDWKYSPAWYPKEVPAGSAEAELTDEPEEATA